MNKSWINYDNKSEEISIEKAMRMLLQKGFEPTFHTLRLVVII